MISHRVRAATSGAAQPAGSGAVQPAGHVKINIGTFNIGVPQSMMTSKKFGSKGLRNMRRIMSKLVDTGSLHLLNLCEMGDHREGLASAGVSMDSIIDGALTPGMFEGLSQGAYAAVYDIAGADGSALKRQWTEERKLNYSDTLDVALALTRYHITVGASQLGAHSAGAAQPGVGVLLCAQLHIRTPAGQNAPSIATKTGLVKEAMAIIEKHETLQVMALKPLPCSVATSI